MGAGAGVRARARAGVRAGARVGVSVALGLRDFPIAPLACVREERRSCDTRVNMAHSSRHGPSRGQQAAGCPHQWHGQLDGRGNNCVTNCGWLSCCGEYEAGAGQCGPSSNWFCTRAVDGPKGEPR